MSNLQNKIRELWDTFRSVGAGSVRFVATRDEVKKWYFSSLIALLKMEVERTNGLLKKSSNTESDSVFDINNGYNLALSQQISHHQELIKGLEK